MSLIVALLFAGLILLYFGAEGLIRGASSLALRLGITPLVVGLTVVAFGTSAPELVVSTKAVAAGQGDIAIGNVVGSNIFNIAVILGLSALLRPMKIRVQLLKFDMPVMLLVTAVCWLLFLDGRLGRIEAGLLVAGMVAYTLTNVIMARRETSKAVETEFAEGTPHRSRHAALDLVLVIGGLALLVLGARLFVDGAVDLARLWGVSEALIGLTIVAAGTSLPELATSVLAAIRKEDDIAIGNIVGSNVFNILGILGVSGLITPLSGSGVTAMDFGFMLGTAFLLLPLMHTGLRLVRWEGAVFLALYGGYIWRLLLI
ncbi:MAG TPA: calcium/sodium antiporter [Kiritimatiellia bacterium]|mgnify:CR=1 FL=1|nr:calcium/sodium antiporter [Kiritimatiellia bacterium]